MLKQSPSRNQRSKGFKVKHFLQICLLLAICIWLLNQLKHSYDKKKAYDDSTGNILEKVQSEHEIIKLGRKDLLPRVDEATLEGESRGDKAELEEDIEELKADDIDDDGRGGGDDEIDGHDQERAEEEESEEVEDLIDVDDRERDVGNEEQDSEEMGDQLEDFGSINHQAQNEGEKNSREAREEHYKGDDASSSVVHNTQTLSSEFQIAGLRKIKVIIGPSDGGIVSSEEKGDEFISANSYAGSDCSSLAEAVANEKPKVKFNSKSIDSGVATISKSMVTEQIMKRDAAGVPEGNNAFTNLNKNNGTAANEGSESVANERAETAEKKLSINDN
ncbi:hypothetical protein P3X46_021160 [Hevea brasiliensis]|uniref:Uncharacterized protein n=1 Tax=Hevea brasiliensis TaxID=3981 RepID=A0ABQ9LEK7_HEVBR|nr:uncharacterized protein LOC110669816 [Hevea brasiliensis]XP_021687317.2 uncharacterized protein LOC110669816 [Hevea brasiliensis]KAJ9166396.1 hypothetical protein P3X46_021160 [Hevea brasiliensis]